MSNLDFLNLMVDRGALRHGQAGLPADAPSLIARLNGERWGNTPPTLTGGEGKKEGVKFVSRRTSLPVMRNGKLVDELFRQPTEGNKAFVDQLTFSFDKSSLERIYKAHIPEAPYDLNFNCDLDCIIALQPLLYCIFGFACSHERNKSANFYSRSFNLGSENICYGYVCIGGGINASNAHSICVELTATGLCAADDGWENRLYNFSTLKEMSGFRYTRVDLAHDFLQGEVTIDDALDLYHQDGFTISITKPRLRKEGYDWFNDTKTGRTLYIGSRQSSRLLRFYEKGKQLKMPDSKWVRCELELRSRDIVIPLDIVIHASDYLVGSYPCFNTIFSSDTGKKVAVKERILQGHIEHYIKYLKIQGSKAVNMLKEFGKEDHEIIDLFTDKTELPKGVHLGQYYCSYLNIDFINHKFV